MPTVIRSTITRTVRAQTQTGGLSERRRSLPQTRRSSGRRERRTAERQRGGEAVSAWKREREGEREKAGTEECISPERRTLEQIRGCASFMSHFTHASLFREVLCPDFAQERTFAQENICFQITRKCEILKRERDPSTWGCFITNRST